MAGWLKEEGTFRARAVEATFGQSSKGTDQVTVLFRTDDGDITWYGYLSDGAADRTLDALKYCGWNGDLDDLSSALTRDVEIVTAYEAYGNNEYLRVKWVNDPSRSPLRQKMDPGKAATFKERMRGKVAAKFPSAPPPGRVDVRTSSASARQAAQAEQQPPQDDDIPF